MGAFTVGDEVRHHSYAHGWRFGVITAIVVAASEQIITVRWSPRDGGGTTTQAAWGYERCGAVA